MAYNKFQISLSEKAKQLIDIKSQNKSYKVEYLQELCLQELFIFIHEKLGDRKFKEMKEKLSTTSSNQQIQDIVLSYLEQIPGAEYYLNKRIEEMLVFA